MFSVMLFIRCIYVIVSDRCLKTMYFMFFTFKYNSTVLSVKKYFLKRQ